MSASAGPNEAEDPRAEADRRIAALGGTLEGTLIRRLGIELNINHLRAVTDGSVIATGTVLRAGRSIAVWDVRVHDDGGGLVAAGRLTLAIREPRPGD